MASSLPAFFHPLLEPWFLRTYGEPTAVQSEAWPVIGAGKHVLAVAPTGSGKTLAAFLDAVSRFALGEYDPKSLSVLYVSPLKALNEDIRRNLEEPLGRLRAWFAQEGSAFPDISVETRSGDTPQSERRRFLVRPPSILATTPESLAILLSSPRARPLFSGVRLVILDEIHAVMDSKRGSFLACQVGRLALLAGEFQRIALSATVSPASTAAEFVGGWRRVPGPSSEARYEPRPVVIVSPRSEKRIEITVEYPPAGGESEAFGEGERIPSGSRYASVVQAIRDRVRKNHTTLVFTDSRRRAERIAFLLNEAAGAGTAYAHHGSLSKEVRLSVEEGLKSGSLPCVVATGSLELGIDVGSVDEVILAGAPPSAAAALQRVGRSGHGVGRTSIGRILPFHGMDLLRSAALAGALRDREIEPLRPIENPLDILAQTILAMCANGSWDREELYAELRSFPPFHTLSRQSYIRVVDMLSGKYEKARLRELKPRLRFDPKAGLLSAADGTLVLLYSSGGAIPDRGTYSLRLADGTRIGELDEEFVWERRVGDAFALGTRSWRIADIGSEAVVVTPLGRSTDFMPFWKAEARYRGSVVVRRTLALLEAYEDQKTSYACFEGLGLSEEARSALGGFLEAQRRAQGGVPLPGSRHIPLELCSNASLGEGAVTAVLHTLRGGAVNEPLALALSGELEGELGLRIETLADEDTVLIVFPPSGNVDPERAVLSALRRLGEENIRDARLRERLEGSGVFGAAFREAAGRSLLLPRARFGKRTPLWVARLRSKRLFEAVRGYGDFPVTAEAWRTCLTDLFDLEGLSDLCSGIRSGEIRVTSFRTRAPSPFAREAVWQETNRFLYEGDEDSGRRGASLSERAIQEALGSERARPPLPAALVSDFVRRLHRETPGWAPEDADALADWVLERAAIPQDEWELLKASLGPEALAALESDPTLNARILSIHLGDAALVVHGDRSEILAREPLALLDEWLRFEGPVGSGRVAEVFSVSNAEAEDALLALADTGAVVRGVRVEGDTLFCDAQNLELLLRLRRKAARPAVEERPAAELAPFLARTQGLLGSAKPSDPWRALSGYAAPAALWETDILPARSPDYRPEGLDRAFGAGESLWFGAGRGIAALCAPEDLDLALPDRSCASRLVPDAARDFWAIRESSGLSTQECVDALWAEAWRGIVSSDTWESLRSGVATRYGRDLRWEEDAPAPSAFGAPRRIPRVIRDRWKNGPPVPGLWFSLAAEDSFDALEEEELDRDRVRLLGRRWGLLCVSLLERELPALGWRRLLPAMRRLELSGELLSGRFFAGVPGLQFMTPEAYGVFLNMNESESVYWMNACDPASLAGSATGDLPEPLPPAVPTTRFSYKGSRLRAIALRDGRDLRVLFPPEAPDAQASLAFLKQPRTRRVRPERKVVVETVNGLSAATSPYALLLKTLGFEADRGKMTLW